MAAMHHAGDQFYTGPDGLRYLWQFPSAECTMTYQGIKFVLAFTDRAGGRWQYFGDLMPSTVGEWKRVE